MKFMADVVVHQALLRRDRDETPRLLARSAHFRNEWVMIAIEQATGFGTRPTGVRCALAIFAQPLEEKHVAVVRVADVVEGDAAIALNFHFLVLTRNDYED